MSNDSIESLLLRHYGENAALPPQLEQRVSASLQQAKESIQQQQAVAARLRDYRLTRRRVVRMVAIGSAGLGLLDAGVAGVRLLLDSPDIAKHSYA
jgi:hypothetical protein